MSISQITPFSPKAITFLRRHPRDDAWINILEGSVRSGKTWTMIVKLMELNFYRVQGLRVMVGVSKSSIYRNILSDLFEFVGASNYSYNSQSGVLWLYGVQWHVIGAADEGAQRKIQGLTAGVIYVDEATRLPRSAWEMLLTRMSPEGARMYATCNPDSPLHYLKTDYLDNADKRANGDVWSEHFTLEDNLSLTPLAIDRLKRSFTGVFHSRYILGLWVIAEGVIYRDCWSDENLYDDETRPIGLFGSGGFVTRKVAIDYGTTNPCVFLDLWDDGRVHWCEQEYYWDSRKKNAQKTDAEYADDLINFIGSGPRPEVIIDPSAASFKVELNRRGIWTADANNEVLDGIRKTASLLAQKKLRFNKAKCPHTINEFQTYAWDDKKSKRGEEEPIKQNDHGPDAARYYVETRVPDWRLAA